MLTVKLTPAQQSAVLIYIADPAHEEDYPEATLDGSFLHFDSSYDRALDILIDAINSADVGDGKTRDVGAVKALDNLTRKLHKLRP